MNEKIKDKLETGGKIYKKPYHSVYEDILFSSARILNLIDLIEIENLRAFLRFEDLNYIDFFASHPFLVFEPHQKEYLDLRYYGFTQNSLEYMNSKHIFSNIRDKLKSVFAYLISKDLIKTIIKNKIIVYQLTDMGRNITNNFVGDYYKAYRISANYILTILKKVNQEKKKEFLEMWMSNSSKFLILT